MCDAIEPATRQAIEQLVAEHAWLIDHGQADRIAALYTDDARVLGIGPDKVGQAAIQAWAAERAAMAERRSRHVQSNLRLVALSPDRVQGTMVLTLYRHDGPGKAAPVPLWWRSTTTSTGGAPMALGSSRSAVYRLSSAADDRDAGSRLHDGAGRAPPIPPETMEPLLQVVPASHLLFGGASSYFPVARAIKMSGKLDLPAGTRDAIKEGNAAALLPR